MLLSVSTRGRQGPTTDGIRRQTQDGGIIPENRTAEECRSLSSTASGTGPGSTRRRSDLDGRARFAAGGPDRDRRFSGRQPLVHSSDGRLGRQPRRFAFAAYAAPLAEFRAERRQADLGRRGGGRATRRASEPESDAGHAPQPPRPDCAAQRTDHGSPPAFRHERRSADRLAADAFRTLLPAELKATGAAHRVSPSAAGRQVRH